MSTRLIAEFPRSFTHGPHNLIDGVQHWQLLDAAGEQLVSVVGGNSGGDNFSPTLALHGDGVTTFEVWFRDEEEPRDWLTAVDINNLLAEKGIHEVLFEDIEFGEVGPGGFVDNASRAKRKLNGEMSDGLE